MTASFVAIVSGLLVVGAGAAGVAADSSGDKMTICHMPHGDPAGARTLQVSRSSWSGHRGHGDHEGPCTDADRKAHPPTTTPPAPAASTRVGLARPEGEGQLDGDASFRVVVVNNGPASARDVTLAGSLQGDGRWTLRDDVPGCTIEKARLACSLGEVPAESTVSIRLDYDGHLDVCREVGVDLRLAAANDASTGDDRARDSVHVGACAPVIRSDAPTAVPSPLAVGAPGA